MASETLEEIKQRVDIVELISGYVTLKKSGANFSARCPFHNEKTPSFIISPSKQIWRCFGSCDEGGDIFGFTMKIEGLEFGDALRLLADRAGVELKKENPQIKTERNRLLDLNERAASYYQKCLAASPSAQDYLTKRAIKKSTIDTFRIGYAPQTSKALRMFRGRVMFPIMDSFGRVLGFSGRVLDPEAKTAKYINSSDSVLYNKSRVLYGWHQAKQAISKNNRCILVEGNVDVIMSHQANVTEVVASSGSALTTDQLNLIRRLTNNLLLAFDSDEAGQKATKRAVELALPLDFNVRLIDLKAKDPADLIARDSKLWLAKIARSKQVIDYFFSRALADYTEDSPQAKRTLIEELLPWIAKIANPIEQSHWLGKLAEITNLGEDILRQELGKADSKQFLPIEDSFKPVKQTLADKLKQQISDLENDLAPGMSGSKQALKVAKARLKLISLSKKRDQLSQKIRQVEKKKSGAISRLIKQFQNVSQKINQLERT